MPCTDHAPKTPVQSSRTYLHLLLLLLLLLLTAIELSLGGSSPCISTDKTIRINIHKPKQYKKHSTDNTKHSQYKYTNYQNTHTLQNPHITKQVKTITVQDTPKLNSHNTIKRPQCKVILMYMVLLSPRTSP